MKAIKKAAYKEVPRIHSAGDFDVKVLADFGQHGGTETSTGRYVFWNRDGVSDELIERGREGIGNLLSSN